MLVYCTRYDIVLFVVEDGCEVDENEYNHGDMEDIYNNNVVALGRGVLNSKYGCSESRGGSGSGL
jgi:hypothetical protein